MKTSTHSPRLTMPVSSRDHETSPAEAKVNLSNMGLRMPHCGRRVSHYKEIRNASANQLRFVFPKFPLKYDHDMPLSPRAQERKPPANKAKFWEMHDILSEHQDDLDNVDYSQIRAEDRHRNDTNLNGSLSEHFAKRVTEISLRRPLRVNGTPPSSLTKTLHGGLDLKNSSPRSNPSWDSSIHGLPARSEPQDVFAVPLIF